MNDLDKKDGTISEPPSEEIVKPISGRAASVEDETLEGKSINLASDQLAFLAPYWAKHPINVVPSVKYFNSCYDFTQKFVVGLRDFVTSWFEKPRHFELEHFVAGNGSSQLLFAYVWAMKQLRPKLKVRLVKPCPSEYLRLPIIFEGLQLTSGPADLVIEFPGLFVPDLRTPEGTINQTGERGRVATLHVCHFTAPPFGSFDPPQGDVIFSLSDSLGLTGLRIGMGFVSNSRLRDSIHTYVDTITRGISSSTFGTAEVLLRDQKFIRDIFEYTRRVLASRWEGLQEVRDPFLLNAHGPFAWFARSKTVFERHGIRGTSGSKVGLSDKYTRISMMGSDSRYKRFLVVLRVLVTLGE